MGRLSISPAGPPRQWGSLRWPSPERASLRWWSSVTQRSPCGDWRERGGDPLGLCMFANAGAPTRVQPQATPACIVQGRRIPHRRCGQPHEWGRCGGWRALASCCRHSSGSAGGVTGQAWRCCAGRRLRPPCRHGGGGGESGRLGRQPPLVGARMGGAAQMRRRDLATSHARGRVDGSAAAGGSPPCWSACACRRPPTGCGRYPADRGVGPAMRGAGGGRCGCCVCRARGREKKYS